MAHNRTPRSEPPPSSSWSHRHPIQLALYVTAIVLGVVGVVGAVVATTPHRPSPCKSYVERMPQTDFSVDCDHADHTLTIEDGYVLCQCPATPN